MQIGVLKAHKYLNSIGVAIKFASITLGAWQRDPSNAIAIPHRNTVTPVNEALVHLKNACNTTNSFTVLSTHIYKAQLMHMVYNKLCIMIQRSDHLY